MLKDKCQTRENICNIRGKRVVFLIYKELIEIKVGNGSGQAVYTKSNTNGHQTSEKGQVHNKNKNNANQKKIPLFT